MSAQKSRTRTFAPGDPGHDELASLADKISQQAVNVDRQLQEDDGPVAPEQEIDRMVLSVLMVHEAAIYANSGLDHKRIAEILAADNSAKIRTATVAVIRDLFMPSELNEKEMN